VVVRYAVTGQDFTDHGFKLPAPRSTMPHYIDTGPTIPVLVLKLWTLTREATGGKFSVFDLTRPGIEPPDRTLSHRDGHSESVFNRLKP